jgi:hypothetical protein
VGFDVTYQILINYFPFVRYCRKSDWGILVPRINFENVVWHVTFTNEHSFISSGGTNRSYWSPISVVAETPGDPKIPSIHGNFYSVFVDLRRSFIEPLRSTRWLEYLIPPVQTL